MECRKYDLLTLGEVLLRLSPPANERMILGVWQEMKFTDSFRKKCLLLPDAFTPAELHWHWIEKVRETAVTLMRKFKEHGTLISFDVKFRGNLWSV